MIMNHHIIAIVIIMTSYYCFFTIALIIIASIIIITTTILTKRKEKLDITNGWHHIWPPSQGPSWRADFLLLIMLEAVLGGAACCDLTTADGEDGLVGQWSKKRRLMVMK